jgi:hypothetical protein
LDDLEVLAVAALAELELEHPINLSNLIPVSEVTAIAATTTALIFLLRTNKH